MIFVIVMPLVDLVWLASIFALATDKPISEFLTLEAKEGMQMFAAVIGAAIWIPYVLAFPPGREHVHPMIPEKSRRRAIADRMIFVSSHAIVRVVHSTRRARPALTGLRIDLQKRHRCVPRPSRDLGGARAIGHLKQQAGHQVAPEQAQEFFGHRVGIANEKPG